MKTEYDLKNLKKRPRAAKSDASATKVPVSIRLDGGVLAALKDEAQRQGIGYQTLVGSILHRYATGELIDKKNVEILKKLKSA